MGRPVGLCGPGDDPAYAAFLVRAGIDSVSVAPDSFAAVKQHGAAAEERHYGEDRHQPRTTESRSTRHEHQASFELVFTAALVYAPPLQNLSGTAALPLDVVLLISAFPSLVWASDEVRRRARRRHHHS
ncbi:hypothetical protein [Streptomyces sp. NPDC060031]|uniref:hypothetical protein n=1 Tax=Streptomyces sp. NPDC060031 TaxID=3347043 RepID=UPI0036966246